MMTLNRDWCSTPFNEVTPNRFTYKTLSEQYAVDQILINGHYLYAMNPDFRELYLDTFKSELTLVGEKEVDFLYKDYFNLFYFGLLAAPYVISQGTSPNLYLERCSAEHSTGLSQFLASETQRLHRAVQARPGMPFYYYKQSKTRFFKDSLSGQMKAICTATPMLEKSIKYAELLNKDAQFVANKLLEEGDPNMKQMMETLKDPSWSPMLYGK
jgi:hypothetical protein